MLHEKWLSDYSHMEDFRRTLHQVLQTRKPKIWAYKTDCQVSLVLEMLLTKILANLVRPYKINISLR